MIDVFLCHSAAARGVALAIAGRLERCAEAKVWTEEIAEDLTVIDAWEGGLSAHGILLVLDRAAVPGQLSRDNWAPILDHLTEEAQPPIAFVRVGDCRYPGLLERSRFFVWDQDPIPVLRKIDRWAIGLHAQRGRATVAPVRLPWFQGREHEMDTLRSLLIDDAGATVTLCSGEASGKSALAQEFAAASRAHFRDVLWVGCSGLTPAAIRGELVTQLGAGRPESAADLLREHRLLVVFDDLCFTPPVSLPENSRSSLLITTRDAGLGRGTTIPLYGDYPAVLPAPASESARLLWQAAAVCRPHGVNTAFAASIASLSQRQAREALDELLSSGLACPIDPHHIRLSAPSRAAALANADVDDLRRRHANTALACLCSREVEVSAVIGEFLPAFRYAADHDWELVRRFTLRAASFLRDRERSEEAGELLDAMIVAAREKQDTECARNLEEELRWVKSGPRVGLRVPPEQLKLWERTPLHA